MSELIELEGTWEEVAQRGSEFAGRRVRLVVFPEPATDDPDNDPAVRPSTGRSLLRHAGTWVGDDLEECLAEVYANRTPARF